jgi:hypothetical protein
MGRDMKGGEISPHLLCDLLFSYFLVEDSHEMGDLNPSLIMHTQPLREVFIDPFPEFLVFLNLMIGLCKGTTTSATEGADGKATLFGKG